MIDTHLEQSKLKINRSLKIIRHVGEPLRLAHPYRPTQIHTSATEKYKLLLN